MKLKYAAAAGALALATAVALSACSSSGGSDDSSSSSSATPSGGPSIDSSLSGTITAGGSSAQANAEAAWTGAFTAVATGVTVNYDKSQGSGGGRSNFLSGAYDFAGSDAPLTADETTQAKTTCGADGAIDLPIYLDGVSISYNLDGVDKLNLSTKTLAKIFSRKITKWNDAAIAADNPGVKLPSENITTVVRSDSSGTANNFTNFLHASDPTDWKWEGSGTWPTDITGTDAQKGGSAVADEIAKVPGAIGYVDNSAAKDSSGNDLQKATVNGVELTSDAVAKAMSDGATTASNGSSGDLSLKFDYDKINADSSAYPIPLVSYAIMCNQFKNADQAKLVKAYIGFAASATGQAVAEKNAKAVPLPQSILDQVQTSLDAVK
ncbi:phosphate ABC transporter substrate-binding protein PstS [Gryllotalpicola ginsengisoli]|uniref:phosphate ABC transporter substrate-binding protein PstS n=1 Tax=Gryllotalpicola ginsengisoli TaxID=444608 RepID=UPI0003B35250|nr:phosphate ABC transporter substrate-binding protein PstS [Gryllotalpicola ginsengisoli]